MRKKFQESKKRHYPWHGTWEVEQHMRTFSTCPLMKEPPSVRWLRSIWRSLRNPNSRTSNPSILSPAPNRETVPRKFFSLGVDLRSTCASFISFIRHIFLSFFFILLNGVDYKLYCRFRSHGSASLRHYQDLELAMARHPCCLFPVTLAHLAV